MREESHLDDMRAAIRGDFERLAERRGGQELMSTQPEPDDPAEALEAPAEVASTPPVPAPDPELVLRAEAASEPEPEPVSVPEPIAEPTALDEPAPEPEHEPEEASRRSWLARLLGR